MPKLPQIFRRLSDDSLQSKVLRGSYWVFLGSGLENAIRLGSTLFLTRLLAPEVFGLMALAAVIIAAAKMLSDVGTGPSVVRSPRGDEPAFLRTAWTMQVIRGVIITGIVCAAAWPVSFIYNQPILFPLICALSISTTLEGFASISIQHCRRHMQLKRLILLQLSVQICVVIVNVTIAWLLQSVWALVIGTLMGSAFRLIMSHLILKKFAHRFELERPALREIVSFGKWIFLATLLTYLGNKGLQAVMGGLVDIETLGLIALATTISLAFSDLVHKVVNNTVFPSVSKINRERPQDLQRISGKVKKAITFGAIPPFVVLSLVGQPLIDLIYDSRYVEVGAMLRLFALNGALAIIAMPYQNLALALGDGRYHAQFIFVSTSMRLIGLYLGFEFWGVFGMIVGIGIGTILSTFYAMHWARRKNIARLDYDLLTMAIIGALMGYAWVSIH